MRCSLKQNRHVESHRVPVIRISGTASNKPAIKSSKNIGTHKRILSIARLFNIRIIILCLTDFAAIRNLLLPRNSYVSTLYLGTVPIL